MLAAIRRNAGLSRAIRAGIVLTIVVAACASASSPAQADYGQAAEHFGMSGESELLKLSDAMDVNSAGSGGVEPGSIYVVGQNNLVARFSPGAEGEAPQFREAWGWGAGNQHQEFQRCGPAYAAEPRPANTFPVCNPLISPIGRGEGAGEQSGNFHSPDGVAVDQATGDVYVLNSPFPAVREHHLIEVFTASGVPIGEGFGDWGRSTPFNSPESISEGPEKLHEQTPFEENGLTVDEDGTVYVIDRDFTGVPEGEKQARVMSFKPAATGNYEHYVYVSGGDTTTSFENWFDRVALVGANRLVAASKSLIREYPAGGGAKAICSFKVSGGTVKAMAVNRVTGESFYFVAGSRAVHRLGPCNEALGTFAELQSAVKPTPETNELHALAVNPSRSWGPQRPAGILYGADAEEHEKSTPVQRGIGDIFVPAKVEGVPPQVEAETASGTTSTSSTLRAQIDPTGFATAFTFEYLSRSEYLANAGGFNGPNAPRVAPSVPGRIGGGGPGIATAAIAGLVPDTEYIFRMVAISECKGPLEPACEAQGPAAAVRTYPVTAAGLPDGRAYELVSPSQKQGGEVFPADPRVSSCLTECKPPGLTLITSVFPMQSAPNGEAVSYMGFPFSSTEGAATFNSYISRRTATGWLTTAMSPPRLSNKAAVSYSESLEQGAIAQKLNPQLAEAAPSGYANLYVQGSSSPASVQPILTNSLFETLSGPLSPHLRPYREAGSLELEYGGHSPDFAAQYFAANDSLTFSSAYAPEPPNPGPTGRDLYEWRAGQLMLLSVLPGNTTVASGASFASTSPETHAIAADGLRVYWTAGGHLYLREDGRTTREVHDPGSFVTASPDGLEVLLSDGCLYSLLTTHCTDLTGGQGGFLGIAGESSSLSRIYFVDTAALAGPNERDEEASSGNPNLYLYEVGVGTQFIASLAASDGAGNPQNPELLDDWAVAPGLRTAEASPDGTYLAFGSTSPLTGYGNVGPCVKVTNAEGTETHFAAAPCQEIFLYDADTARLSCPSCNPTDEAPLGNSTLRRIVDAQNNGWLPQPRYLTNRGRLFFDSSDRLSPRDSNGSVEDVYESEPLGGHGEPISDNCDRAGGCVSLISPGTGSVDSNFLAMGGEGEAEGDNVFFTTRERLVPSDVDGLIDVYDARVDGGFPVEAESSSAECQGEACQSTLPNPPSVTGPGTSDFQGSGNMQAKQGSKCPKGKVRKGGECVKRKSKKGKKHATERQARTAGHKRGGSK